LVKLIRLEVMLRALLGFMWIVEAEPSLIEVGMNNMRGLTDNRLFDWALPLTFVFRLLEERLVQAVTLGGLSPHPDIDGLSQLQVGEASPLSEGLHIPHRLFMVLFDLAISDLSL